MSERSWSRITGMIVCRSSKMHKAKKYQLNMSFWRSMVPNGWLWCQPIGFQAGGNELGFVQSNKKITVVFIALIVKKKHALNFLYFSEILHGWFCFIVCLFMIGMLTMIVGDLALHFGCTIGLKPTVTAITFVALGTSLPGKSHSPILLTVRCTRVENFQPHPTRLHL